MNELLEIRKMLVAALERVDGLIVAGQIPSAPEFIPSKEGLEAARTAGDQAVVDYLTAARAAYWRTSSSMSMSDWAMKTFGIRSFDHILCRAKQALSK